MFAQPTLQVVDLQSKWLVQTPQGFVPFNSQSTSSIYFWLLPPLQNGSKLMIEGRHGYSVWINSKLIWKGQGLIRFSIDSLSRLYPEKMFLSVNSVAGFNNIITKVETTSLMDEMVDLIQRKQNHFPDFAVIASLILMISFTLLLRTNPTLTRDYFNLFKLITSIDRAESGFGLRIASSVNILYYIFGSCFLALMLLVAFHLMGSVTLLSKIFQIQDTGQGFLNWFFLSFGIFGLLLLKLVCIAVFAALFGFKDTVRFQFFNFVRIIFISMTILVIINIVFVVFHVQTELFYYYQLYLLVGLFGLGTVVVYIKLLARLPYHFFHLFSYLCISEIIPLLVLTKLILY
ncbi:MAG: DUF4271 domain-containing protein [Flammeovirgaceae bacterium]